VAAAPGRARVGRYDRQRRRRSHQRATDQGAGEGAARRLLIGDVTLRRGLVLVVVVVDDHQDLDEGERGVEAAKGHELVGVDSLPRGP
jgi:hypothetical protein